jgi:hypothetical protein
MCRVKTEEKEVSYSYKNALQVQASEYSTSQVPVIGLRARSVLYRHTGTLVP